ncbi:protein kinase domain-containing protein [Xanthocytophaga agilis]|uniref:Protein kinase n=1 Tax=Xanthocytophaga agilis TaxID=3048010 RepID=A0AAE3RAC8_9BACT|nr:protein kinase [Xanthocytophaga agilis]MDJ1506609.1 protein kinase [Xanthocytophaga agilis]
MSSQEQLQTLIRALITNGTLSEVQKSIIYSHAELQGVPPEETERMIQEALQQASQTNTPSATDQSGFITNNPTNSDTTGSSFVDSNSSASQQNVSQSNASQANYSGIQFGAGTGFTDATLLSEQGGMSITQKARLDGRWVVVKRVASTYKYNQTYADLLFKEYFNGRDLEHPHIVNIYGRGEDTEGPFFYMEYIDGQSLRKRIPEGGIKDQRLIRKIAVEILDALSYAHKKQVYHRDLKPENILITNKGDNVKIIDFGLAAADKFDDLSGATFVGTQKYAAPEQSSALNQVDGRTDLYAFGLILLEMFTGSPEPKNLKQLPVGYWRSIIDKCLQSNPSDRYQNAGEILEYINSYSSSVSQPVSSPPVVNQSVTPPPVPVIENRPVHTQPKTPVNRSQANQPVIQGLQKLPNDVLILVLGILSIITCGCGFFVGIIALILASQSHAAYMQNPAAYDPGSRQLVNTGKICAIVGTILGSLIALNWFAEWLF